MRFKLALHGRPILFRISYLHERKIAEEPLAQDQGIEIGLYSLPSP